MNRGTFDIDITKRDVVIGNYFIKINKICSYNV